MSVLLFIGDNIVCKFKYFFCGTVILLEFIYLCTAINIVKRQYVFDFRAAPAVNALVVVSDNEKIAVFNRKPLRNRKLYFVGILKLVDKGTTAALTIEAGKKALAAGMKLSTMILLGLGGQERTKEHALHTAQVVSAINPTMLSALSLIIPHEVPLYQDVVEGTFTPLTARGFLKELDMILRHTEMTKPCIFRSNHVSNLLPVGGTLPMDKEKMLAALERYIPQVDDTLPLLNDNGNF